VKPFVKEVREIGATIKDVAKYTGLSIATISKYINGGNVLDRNRKVIEEAIRVLNFKVNEMARGLKTNKTKTIGILIPNLEQSFCTTIVSSIENILIKHGYSTIICDYKENEGLEKEKLQFLVNKMVDGIVIMPIGNEGQAIQRIIDSRIVVVLVDRALRDVECDMVLVDNLNASYNAVEQFIVRGHRRIGIIVGPENVYTAEERLKGYYRVHEDYSMDINEELIRYGNYKIDSGYELLNEFIDMEDPPTAIFVTNYEMTMGAIMAINERNISIPDELSLIGFDNLEMAKIIKPPLSIVIQPMEKIGETAAETLLKRLEENMSNFPARYRLKAEVLIRGSVKNI
jgi:LacI family transcriptional regulator